MKLSILFSLLLLLLTSSCKGEGDKNKGETSLKETYFPKESWRVEEGNDYQDPNSQFNVHRMLETDNLVAFWEAGFGDDPETCDDPAYRFPLRDIMQEADKMFVFFRDELKFAEKGSSITDKYRMILYFYYSDEGTVYGGSADDNKVGVMWINPGRVKKAPYGAIAHEMGHAFQSIVKFDKGGTFSGGSIYEMTSQYMLWQYYPEWITFENYHLVDFMKKYHHALLHPTNMYHAPFVLEYWASMHGNDFIGHLWRNVAEGEDPVMTYQRVAGMTQEAFNEKLAGGYLRFMTWDMDRIRKVSEPYINQHLTAFDRLEDGWYRVAKKNCPQNYGYNGIQLNVPAAGTTVNLRFKGVAGAEGYDSYRTDKAGWRYGFVAHRSDGERVYSEIFSNPDGTASFKVPDNTRSLWLVVMGAPSEHKILDTKEIEEWPYQIKLENTTLTNP